MSRDGFENEEKILYSLNNRNFYEICNNLKLFIEFACKRKISANEIVNCKKIGGQNKSDISIVVNNSDKFSVSIKKGKGNSVHQEPLKNFISFLKATYNIDNSIKEALQYFIWGDGTYDGKGMKQNRMDALTLKKKYPGKIKILKEFFYSIKRDLIYRFAIKGAVSRNTPDFIYYGSSNKGLWVSSNHALNFLCDDRNESKSVIPIGILTFQAWNRAIKDKSLSEHKRGVVQIKWPNIEKDLRLMVKNEKK